MGKHDEAIEAAIKQLVEKINSDKQECARKLAESFVALGVIPQTVDAVYGMFDLSGMKRLMDVVEKTGLNPFALCKGVIVELEAIEEKNNE